MLSKSHRHGRPFWVDAIHIFALAGLAVAQPVYSSLAAAPQFFVAHRASPIAVTILAVCLSIGLPFLIIALEGIIRSVNRSLGRGLHVAVVAVLLFAFALQLVARLADQSLAIVLLFATALAVAGSALYLRSALFNRMLSILTIGALIFPLNFLFASPVSKIIIGSDGADLGEISAPLSDTPVVLLILDEFNPTVLLNRDGKIDAVRYPNFAQFADQSWWFPRATTTHPHTQYAVPAILTGKLPDERKQFPSYEDHPKNLFTMFGASYSLNVSENLTSLCPASLCKADEKIFDHKLFAADIAVVIGHVLLPQALAAKLLPPLDVGWNGFMPKTTPKGDAPADEDEVSVEQQLVKAFGKQANWSRLDAFRDFIAKSGAGSRHLDFLHVLLPHQPYQFFPSGMAYDGGSDIGFSNDIWSANQNLINLAYQRYMMQVGLLDTLIGELIAHLKDAGVYDRSLVVVTGDHGRSFRAGSYSRELTGDNFELLHIPLFIKMPYQKQGEVSHAQVSNMDIVPTIVEVLGIDVSWDFDGESVFSKNRNSSRKLDVTFRKNKFSFDRDAITGYPLLEWQSKTFLSNAPLRHLQIKSEYSHLIGREVRSFEVAEGTLGPLAALATNLSSFAKIDRNHGYLPALFQSEIVGDARSAWVAIAMNGVIVSVAPTFRAEDGVIHVASLLPEDAFRQGSNQISAFFIEGSSQSPKLSRILTNQETYEIQVDGGVEHLRSSDAKLFIILKDRVFGYVERVLDDGLLITINGWAADTGEKQAVQTIVVLKDDKFVCAKSNPMLSRPDVADHFKSHSIEASGFSVACPLKGMPEQKQKSLRVFGISSTGEVGELGILVDAYRHAN